MAHNSKARLAEIIASAADAIVSTDQEQRIIVFNSAAEKLFGYRAAGVIGKPLDLLIPERFGAQHREHIRRFGVTGEIHRSLGQLGEIVGLRADGEEILLDATISQAGSSPHKIFTAFLRDVTERRRAELAMRAREFRIEGVIASLAEGIVSIDETLRIVLVNPAAEHMFGRSLKEMFGQPLSTLIPERFRAQHDEHIRRFAATGQTNRAMGKYGLIYGLRAGGEEFPIEATISQSGASGNKLLTVILRDITERRRMERALRDDADLLRRLSRRLFEAEEMQRRRLARELHDRIGQNVTALSLNLNMVRSELPEDCRQKVKTRLDDCETLLFSTGKLVRDVMADLRPPGLDELGLVAALTEHARQVAGRGGISVTVNGTEVSPRLPPATEITLFRIAQEALINVAKHAQATAATLTLESRPAALVLIIADNGRGFDTTLRSAQPLPSLGMVSMRERAESIGARLSFESAPGHGTRVIVEAPRAPPDAADRPHLPGIEPA